MTIRTVLVPVTRIEDLLDDDTVMIGSHVYDVRIEELRGNGKGARFKDQETHENIHFHVGARALCDAGVVRVRRSADVRPGDVWGTEKGSWIFLPPMGAPWLSMDGDPRTTIPETATLKYRPTVED